MKRTIAILLLAFTTVAFAQEKKDEEFNTTREFKTRMITVKNRDPRDIYAAVRLLGSGFKGSAISYNQETHTMTVRDFPENVATIEDAITRLDKPMPAEADIELKISILLASKTPLNGAAIPDDLAPVVRQLESTLRYPHYGLMTTGLHRASASHGAVDGSGVADAALLGVAVQQGQPVFYSYRLANISMAETGSIAIQNFKFDMRLPIRTGVAGQFQYQSVGFDTPVTLKPNEKVVIGTTTLGDKALIVVVNAMVRGQ